MNIKDIKQANKAAGFHFFSDDTMKFFKSKVYDVVFEGPGGVFFVTSERFTDEVRRFYTVRQFYPESGSVNTEQDFNTLSKDEAFAIAHSYAMGNKP